MTAGPLKLDMFKNVKDLCGALLVRARFDLLLGPMPQSHGLELADHAGCETSEAEALKCNHRQRNPSSLWHFHLATLLRAYESKRVAGPNSAVFSVRSLGVSLRASLAVRSHLRRR